MDNLPVIREPESVLQEGKKSATALMSVVNQKKKPVKIGGETYLEFEDWQLIAEFDGRGYVVKTRDAILVEVDGIKGAKAVADLIDREGRIIGGAEAYCMRDEKNWIDKPWFQLASMAQTRAGAKALRNKFSFIAPLAGVKSTPAEEMEHGEQKGVEYPSKEGTDQTSPHSPPPPEEDDQYQEGISERQTKALWAISKDLKWSEDKVKSEGFKIVGHPIEHFKDLTKNEAREIIGMMQGVQRERAKGV